MKSSPYAHLLIRQFESLRLTAYRCSWHTDHRLRPHSQRPGRPDHHQIQGRSPTAARHRTNRILPQLHESETQPESVRCPHVPNLQHRTVRIPVINIIQHHKTRPLQRRHLGPVPPMDLQPRPSPPRSPTPP